MKIVNRFMMLGWALAAASLAAVPQARTDPGTTGVRAQATSTTQTAAGGPAAGLNTISGGDYSVLPRKPQLSFFPCSQCHQNLPPNPAKRELYAPHQKTLEHGGDRFWCLNCHSADDRDHLRTVDGTLLDFDNAPELCATCHMARYRDWKGGAHGKRIGTWQGDRIIAACPQCHNPHSPTIKPRAPKPPPPVRRDLARPQLGH